jgi:UDP-N-acetylmuramate dehydrogenase
MKVVERPSLRALNTFGVDASADLLLAVESEEDILSLPGFDPARDLVLGGGSNLVLASDVPGTVYHVCISGRHVLGEQSDHAMVEIGAGEDWHRAVLWTLQCGYSGLENLSLIPGTVGAAPLQNIGAYGVELADVLDRVTAWDWQRAKWVSFSREDCRLGYRDSLFKSAAPGRYLVTSVRLRLDTAFRPRIDYAGLREELSAAGTARPTAMDVSDAIIRIRQRRLPDPARIGNAGSFFKNPVVDRIVAGELLARYPDLPSWPQADDRVKLSAAWMVERCGLKGLRDGDAAVSDRHALVLVNHGAAKGAQIIRLSRRIQSTVAEAFGIMLEAEPRLVEFKQ